MRVMTAESTGTSPQDKSGVLNSEPHRVSAPVGLQFYVPGGEHQFGLGLGEDDETPTALQWTSIAGEGGDESSVYTVPGSTDDTTTGLLGHALNGSPTAPSFRSDARREATSPMMPWQTHSAPPPTPTGQVTHDKSFVKRGAISCEEEFDRLCASMVTGKRGSRSTSRLAGSSSSDATLAGSKKPPVAGRKRSFAQASGSVGCGMPDEDVRELLGKLTAAELQDIGNRLNINFRSFGFVFWGSDKEAQSERSLSEGGEVSPGRRRRMSSVDSAAAGAGGDVPG